MSKRSLLRSFQSDAQLRQFFLEKVFPTGNELGIGSYGMVIEVEYNKKSCAAKKIHEMLIQSGNEGIRDIIEKYRRECQLMASLQHPNITQFMGLCFLEGSQLPLLVMEKLEMSVDDLLECIPNIALTLKLSILIDTCKGLEYLHDRKSPIIHRDLSARNVLLTSSLTAKIADLGNSRIVDFKPGQLAKTLSKNPGTTVYMPPEALNEIHRYGPSLDVFSFGHLTLYSLTQIFPGELLSAAYPNPDNPDHIIGRSEVKRRATYMSMLESTYSLSYPELIEIVEHSLHNIPERRPLTKNLLSRLQDVKKKADRSDGMNKMKEHYISSILYVKDLKEEHSERIKEFKISLERLETDYLESMSANERLKDEKREQYGLIETLQSEKVVLESDRSKFEALTSQLKGQLQQLESNLIDLQKQLEEKKRQLQHAHEELKNNAKSMESMKSVESVKQEKMGSALNQDKGERESGEMGETVPVVHKYCAHICSEGWSKLTKEDIIDHIKGIVYGQAIGDALGLATASMSKKKAKQTYRNPKDLSYKDIVQDSYRSRWDTGNWTKNTNQMLLIMLMIIERNGSIDQVDFADRLYEWMCNGFSDFGDYGGIGIGATMSRTLRKPMFLKDPVLAARIVWEESGKYWAANGAIMRTSILGALCFNDLPTVVSNTVALAEVTHADPRCIASCVAITVAIALMLQGNYNLKDKRDIYALIVKATEEACKLIIHEPQIQEMRKHIHSSLDDLQLDERNSTGYTFKAMGCGFYGLKGTDFRKVITAVIMEAGDADTNAAVCGAVLGCKIGFKNLPKDLLELKHKNWLELKVNAFLKVTGLLD